MPPKCWKLFWIRNRRELFSRRIAARGYGRPEMTKGKDNMKTLLILICLAIGSTGLAAPLHAQETKMLIAYFSWSGNTRGIAEQIHQKVGGDLIEIEPIRPYSRDYNTCLEEARKDLDSHARP